jgi:hypothetical protein
LGTGSRPNGIAGHLFFWLELLGNSGVIARLRYVKDAAALAFLALLPKFQRHLEKDVSEENLV